MKGSASLVGDALQRQLGSLHRPLLFAHGVRGDGHVLLGLIGADTLRTFLVLTKDCPLVRLAMMLQRARDIGTPECQLLETAGSGPPTQTLSLELSDVEDQTKKDHLFL